MEYSQAYDAVRFEKAGFYLLRSIPKLRQLLEVVLVLGLISWTTPFVPALLKTATANAVRFSAYLLNHHVVFLIGNSIVALLFVLFRGNDDADIQDRDCEKRGELAPPEKDVGGGEEDGKQIVVRVEETVAASSQCDDVAAVIEKAARQIKRFERTQSEKLRREIGARPQKELRRSESVNRRSSGETMERLSSDEFQRTVDAFISKHWGKKTKNEDGCIAVN